MQGDELQLHKITDQTLQCKSDSDSVSDRETLFSPQGADEGLRVRSHFVEVLDVERKRVPLVRIYLKYI